MDRQKDTLQQIARIARSCRDFFVSVYPTITDAEVRTAFAYISEVKSQLLVDLARWLPPSAYVDHDPADHISPATTMEKMYSDARNNFNGAAAPACASALAFGEEQLMRQLKRAFEQSTETTFKELIKSYYPQLVICREAMLRLRVRQAA